MQRIIKALKIISGLGALNSYRQLSFDLLKVRAATAYLKGVRALRRWWIGAIIAALMLLLMAAGFVMAHVGFFLWAPWELSTKALLLMLLGLLYMLIALLLILRTCSEKTWMQGSLAKKIVEKAAGQGQP